jgi:mannose-6-phosphate isomerase-like protein (cupin superfamily)
MTKLSITDALEKLSRHDGTFIKLYSHGTLEVEIYKPENVDLQQPHSRDEIYVVATGSGKFICGEQIQQVQAGDFLFAPAGMGHKFLDFTNDFSTWVCFYGPEGGER